MRGTYSLEDNKLRLYPSHRLDEEDYARFKKAGYKWAPRQELFVAPMWTPLRFDMLLEFCGEVEDEEQSLMDRAEERAGRFEDYSDSRAADSDAAYKNAKAIGDHIPFGQPILVGHHSERRHRKDVERIDNSMRKSVQMQRASDYWKDRASSTIYAAERKGRPDVRARRIKKLGAEMRKRERQVKACHDNIGLWNSPDLTQEKAESIAGGSSYSYDFYCEIRDQKITPERARERALKAEERSIQWAERWIEHYQLRLEYETNVLEQQGGADLLKPKPRAKTKQPPLCNHDTPVLLENIYGGEHHELPVEHMTKAEWARTHNDYKSVRKTVDGTHRVRTALIRRGLKQVFLTDSKVHAIPKPVENED